MKDWKPYTFNEAVDCNPKVTIKKGDIIENCEMEDINPNYKYLYPREGKLYKGSNSKFQNGDTVFARITPCLENGKIAQVKGLKKNCGIGSTEFFVFRGKKNVSDSDFVFYLTKTNLVRDTAVNSMTGASGRQRADIKAVKKIKVQLPPLPTQQRIASILSAYDDLIEVNNQRIKLLEQTARELYKEWFVRMRFPGYKQAKFKKGVPEGWEVKPILSLCSRITDGTHDTPKPTADGIYLITGTHLRDNEIDFSFAYKISLIDHEKIKKRSGLNKGDILFSNIGTIGSTAIVIEDFEYSVKNVIIFKPLKMEYSLFLNYLIKSEGVKEQMLLDASGTSQQFISLGYIRKLKTLIPDENLIEKYSGLVQPMFEQLSILNQQNTQLRQIRDRLLPRLISGKLQVSEAAFSELKNEQD